MFRVADAFFHGEVLNGEVGIEIELEGEGLPDHMSSKTYWNVTRDGSLRGEAFEYVLKSPIDRNLVPEALSQLYDRLSKATLEDSGRAGVHIHVNVRDLSIRQLYNFLLIYLVFEKNLVDFCGSDRIGNLFCLRAVDAEYLLVSIRKLLKTHDFRSNTKSDSLRYAAVNLTSILKYGSLEFRSLASPVTQETIENWVRLLLSIKDYSKEVESPTNVVLGVSEMGGEDFARCVFKENLPLLNSSDWRLDVVHGMRLIQPLANSFDSTALDEWEKAIREEKDRREREQREIEERINRVANGIFNVIPQRDRNYDNLNDAARVLADAYGAGWRSVGRNYYF